VAKTNRKQRDPRVTDLRSLLRVPPDGNPVSLSSYDPSAKSGGPPGKVHARAGMAGTGSRLTELQDRVFAQSTTGDRRRLLLVLQGMDTSGKGGTVKHVLSGLNPVGCRYRAFKPPTEEERAHHFLWRVERSLPQPGEIGVFDRSHYEDVLVARVRGLVPPAVWMQRYDEINAFERRLAEDGVTIIKVFLHISREEQLKRLLARLDKPHKHWKFSPSDIDDRALWPAYQEAYEAALARCSTPAAPWYVVPADRKWYRNWAVGRLLLEHLEEIDPQYPPADFDVEECRKRLLET
jgi:PPK2 family polyphosphate:nucleotide phosphotransferase